MTTAAQVKRVTRPLLERNADLALVGRLVVIKPVRHILRGVYVDRSLDPTTVTPTWLVSILFEHGAHVIFNWGGRLYNRAHGPWDVTNATTPTVLCEEIEQHALPLLRPVQSLDDFVAFASKERFPFTYLASDYLSKLMVDIARGDFDAAQTICTKIASGRTIWSSPDMREDFDRVTKELCPKVAADDRLALARLLHAWEADSVKRLKLEKLWEPTPFPLELQLARK